jgi:integrase
MFETGMRVGQCLGLRHEDVRIWKREIRIEPRVDNANGARGKRGIGTAFISQRAAQLYLLYMDCEYGPIDSDYVFVNLWGGEVGGALTYRSVYDLVTRTRRRVGFHFTPHQLRHTFVTRARRHGVSLEVVSKLVTHQCVSTTADIYSHLEPEDLRREIEAAGLWNDLEGAA